MSKIQPFRVSFAETEQSLEEAGQFSAEPIISKEFSFVGIHQGYQNYGELSRKSKVSRVDI